MAPAGTGVIQGSGAARVVLAVACLTEFLVVLDASVVNVALPSIRESLGLDDADLSWVVNAYLLVFAGGLLLGGRLADVWGARRALLVGLAAFTAASVFGGLAPVGGVLLVSRAVQGGGAALLMPAGLAWLTTTFPDGPARARALAVWAAIASAGGATGSLLGGGLTATLGWRSVLLVNVPLGLTVLALVRRSVGGGESVDRRADLDVPGALTATLGIGALTLGLVTGPERGWTSATVTTSLVLGVLLLGVLVRLETRWSARPLLPLCLLRERGIAVGNLLMVLAGGSLMPMWFFLSIYQQEGLGLDALRAGLGFLPHTVLTVLLGTRLTPWLMARVEPRRLVVAGAVVLVAGFLVQARVAPGDTYLTGVAPAAVLIALGGAVLNTPLTALTLADADAGEEGAASGLMNTTKQLGGVLGLAALVALTTRGDDTPDRIRVVADTGTVFAAMAALSAVVAAVALLLPRHPA